MTLIDGWSLSRLKALLGINDILKRLTPLEVGAEADRAANVTLTKPLDFQYGSGGLLETITDDDDDTVVFAYDSEDQVSTVTNDKSGLVTTIAWYQGQVKGISEAPI